MALMENEPNDLAEHRNGIENKVGENVLVEKIDIFEKSACRLF